MQRPTAVNETNTLSLGAIFEGDTVVGQLLEPARAAITNTKRGEA